MPNYLPEGNQPRPNDTTDRALQKINGILLEGGLGVSVVNSTSGAGYIGGTGLNSGTWSAIQMVTDTKFHTLTGNITGVANTAIGSAPEIPGGFVLFGNFTALQLHSGSVVAYNA